MTDQSPPADGGEATDGDADGAPTADAPSERPLEPGSPSVENAVFVLLGVVATLVVWLLLLQ